MTITPGFPSTANPNRQELEILDEATGAKYNFTIAPGEKNIGKMFSIEYVDWEPVDGKLPWRTAIHPWDAGLAPNRINPHVTFAGDLRNRPDMVYAKAGADASNPNYLTASPQDFSWGTAIVSTFFNTPAQLRYDSSAYGTTTYMGPASTSSDFYKVTVPFNGKSYFSGGQFLYSVDASLNYALVHDFGAGKRIYDTCPYQGNLIIAMGPTEKIWSMDSSQIFTQATDATFATALIQVDQLLWRCSGTNLVSSAITAPLTLASWATDYTVGNSTYNISGLAEQGGVVTALRPDGVFQPDAATVFHNQTPQLKDYPHPDNCVGTWNAFGTLMVPSIIGCLQVSTGSSIPVGPELALRPDYRLRVRGGVQWGANTVFFLCDDEAGSGQTFVCKATRDLRGISDSNNPFIYHEWKRLGDTGRSYVICVFTLPTNPTMIVGHGGGGLKYWSMGRGAGADVDDSNYQFSTTYELESGDFIPTLDRGIEVSLTGVKIVGKQPAGSTLNVSFDMDHSGAYTPMLDTQDGAGTTSISDSGFFTSTRYAPPNTVGHVPRIKLSGTIPANTFGTNRPEIYEAWAFGDIHPATTEVFTIGIYADRRARVWGLMQGRPKSDNAELFSTWTERGSILQLRVPGYAEDEIVHGVLTDIKHQTINVLIEGGKQTQTQIITITVRRVDFSGALYG